MMKILEKLIHSIVPHQKNNNIPHILRYRFVVVTAFLVVVLFVVNQNNFTIIRGLNLTGAIYPAVLADMNNQDRTANGFRELAWSPTLENAARLKAEDMIANSYFAHESPAGVSPWFWLSRVNYDFIYAGENLAIDFTESEDVQKAWLDSPSHRANLLGANFTEIGISALDGNFNGRNTTFVVQYFGKPLQAKAPAPGVTSNVVTQNTESSNPEVAGASVTKTPTKQATSKTQITILTEEETDGEKLIVAQNRNTVDETPEVSTEASDTSNVSAWYMRLAVDPSHAVKTVYSIIISLVTLAVVLLLLKEYQKHHIKHVVLGLVLIAFTGALFYLLNTPSVLLIASLPA